MRYKTGNLAKSSYLLFVLTARFSPATPSYYKDEVFILGGFTNIITPKRVITPPTIIFHPKASPNISTPRNVAIIGVGNRRGVTVETGYLPRR
jgi:hypothetical protein